MILKNVLLDYVEDGLTHLDRVVESGDIAAAARQGEIFANSALSMVDDDDRITSRRAKRLVKLASSTLPLAVKKRR